MARSTPATDELYGEASMASLIFGFLGVMAAILVVLMVLLNSYLQRFSPTAMEEQPPPPMVQNAGAERKTEQVSPVLSSTGSPSGEALRTLTTDVEVSKGPDSPPPAVDEPHIAQPPAPATPEAVPATPDDTEEAPAAPAAEAKDGKPHSQASHHRVSRHHGRTHRSAQRYNGEASYGF
jgi:cytoskeletal protein RodZ